MFKIWKTPGTGEQYGMMSTQYLDTLNRPHCLIAGTVGSGKSVLLNGIIRTALFESPATRQFILIDPKMTELIGYRDLPHTIAYADSPGKAVKALQLALDIILTRVQDMQRRRLRTYDGPHVYVIIDEMADLLTVDSTKRDVKRLLQRICQIGRAGRVHVIGCTQRPTSDVIGNAITVNMDARWALRTRSAQESRNIIGAKGCETLAKFGTAYYMTPDEFNLYNIPYYTDTQLQKLVDYWMNQRPRYTFRKPA